MALQEEVNRQLIEKAKHEISHGTDGPITAFVLISRACKDEVMANALYEELKSFNFLRLEGESYYDE